MMSDRLSDELEALRSIYGEQHISYDGSRLCYTHESYMLTIDIPSNYPDVPISNIDVEFSDASLLRSPTLSSKLKTDAEQLCLDHMGEEVLYQLIELYRSYFEEIISSSAADKDEGPEHNSFNIENELTADEISHDDNRQNTSSLLHVIHGDILVERKSSFQAHFAFVRSMDEVNEFRDIVLQDKKVSNFLDFDIILLNLVLIGSSSYA